MRQSATSWVSIPRCVPMRKWAVPLMVGGGVILVLGLAGAVGYAIGRTLTAPYSGRRYTTRILAISSHGDRSRVTLVDAAQTRRPGRYGAFLPDGRHIRFSTDVVVSGPGVARGVTADAADAMAGVERISWTGIEFPTPSEAGLHAVDVTIASEHGPVPAWVIGSGAGATWAVHIHGLGSSRAGTLRGVQVASELGFTSLVTTYRNSAEGPQVGSRRTTLGLEEFHDVERALDYAVKHGAEQIVLFGWSMGANIALRLAHDSRWSDRVLAVVAESPVLDWRATVSANLTSAGLPSWTAHLAYPWLTSPRLARRLGLACEINLDLLDWSARDRIRIPTLILLGRHDRSTPWRLAEQVAAVNPYVTLELFEADHTMTWNSDPKRWRSTVKSWLRPGLDKTS